MIFTRTKRTAQKVADELDRRGFAAAAVHGDLGQGAREQALRAFRSGKVDVLVATDVAARGIDVGGRHPRHQLPVPGRREDLHPPDRPHRPGRRDRRRGDVRRLGRHAALEADHRQDARPGHAGAARRPTPRRAHLFSDLDIPTELHRHAAARRAHPGRAGRRAQRRSRPPPAYHWHRAWRAQCTRRQCTSAGPPPAAAHP